MEIDVQLLIPMEILSLAKKVAVELFFFPDTFTRILSGSRRVTAWELQAWGINVRARYYIDSSGGNQL